MGVEEGDAADGPKMRCAMDEPVPNPNPCTSDEPSPRIGESFGGGEGAGMCLVFFAILRGMRI